MLGLLSGRLAILEVLKSSEALLQTSGLAGSEIVGNNLGSASFGCEVDHKVVDLVVDLLQLLLHNIPIVFFEHLLVYFEKLLDLPELLIVALLFINRLSYFFVLFAPQRSLSCCALLLKIYFCPHLSLYYLQLGILRGLKERKLGVRQSTLNGEIRKLLVFFSQLV